MEFKDGNITVKIINPEAIPIAQKNLAKLILKMAQKEIDRQNSTLIGNKL